MLRFFNSAGSEHFQYGGFSSDAEAPLADSSRAAAAGSSTQVTRPAGGLTRCAGRSGDRKSVV
jgi:hypothetical protein